MSDDPIATIRIDETHRVLVYPDDGPVNPRKDWEMSTGALTIRGDSRTIEVEPVYEFPGHLRDADEHLYGVGSETAGWGGASATVKRWARIFYGIELQYVEGTYWWMHPGQLAGWSPVGEFEGQPLYRYGAGPELLTSAALQHRVIDADRESYEKWAAGEVYGLRVEKFKLKARLGLNEDGELIILDEDQLDIDGAWDEVQAVWGFYLDPSDDDAVIAEAKELY